MSINPVGEEYSKQLPLDYWPKFYASYPNSTRKRFPTITRAIVCSIIFIALQAGLAYLCYSIPGINTCKSLFLPKFPNVT